MSRAAQVASLLLVALLTNGTATDASAQDGPIVNSNLGGELTLRELLEKDLRARREVEFQFIDRVVARVEEKQIPLDTVMTMYRWSKKKSRRPYQYFEKGMKVQAKRLGVDLLAPDEEDPKGGFFNFFRDVRVGFKRFRVQL